MYHANPGVVLSCLLMLTVVAGCGESDDLRSDLKMFGSADQTAEVEAEIHAVMGETRNAILGSALTSLMSGSEINLGSCNPQLDWGLSGATLTFTASDSCKFDGTIGLTFLPLAAAVDLEVVGLKFVESMHFDADIAFFQENGGLQLSWEFLNGQIQLKASSFFPVESLMLNGKVNVQMHEGHFSLSSRTNAFDATTGTGLALLAQLERHDGESTGNFQGCVLKGGVGDTVDAGEVSNCIPK